VTAAHSDTSIRTDTRSPGVTLQFIVAVVLILGSGCSGAETPAREPVEPVERVESDRTLVPVDPVDEARPSNSAGAGAAEGAPPSNPQGAPGAARATLAEIDAALLRYDELVTRLAADPVATSDPAHPARIEWATLVPVGTMLAEDVIEQLVSGPAAEGTRLVPPPEGSSYRHRALSVASAQDDGVEFSWCGYSPGVRVDLATGAVVDDDVAYVHGSGRLRPGPGGWVIDALDHLALEVHPPGSPDPCPDEQAGLLVSEGR